MAAILVIDGHPDPHSRLCHALSQAYIDGAREAGHETRLIRLADAQITPLRSAAEFAEPPASPAMLAARDDIQWAEHLVFVFPLWLGGAPALVRAFLEQIARGGFFAEMSPAGPKGRLKGRSARLIVTMGMPGLVYRLVFGAFGVRGIARSVLGFAGVRPVRMTFFGGVDSPSAAYGAWLKTVRSLGWRRA